MLQLDKRQLKSCGYPIYHISIIYIYLKIIYILENWEGRARESVMLKLIT